MNRIIIKNKEKYHIFPYKTGLDQDGETINLLVVKNFESTTNVVSHFFYIKNLPLFIAKRYGKKRNSIINSKILNFLCSKCCFKSNLNICFKSRVKACIEGTQELIFKKQNSTLYYSNLKSNLAKN